MNEIDGYLAAFERALSGTANERAASVAILRRHLDDAAASGSLGGALDELGPPEQLAARFEASGAGHRHRDPVVLPNGVTVWACSFLDEGYGRDAQPAFGLYLDDRWAPPWPHEVLDWPDFGLPTDPGGLRRALEGTLARAMRGETVEIGCLGGHGRTGTALACLVVLAGEGAVADPVGWVRANYCEHAIETDEQAAFVAGFTTAD